MELIVKNENGWTEAYLDENCNDGKFYLVAVLLETDLGIEFTSKASEFDSIYWEFKYKETSLLLHYNIYFGVSIFPACFKKATQSDNEKVLEIGKLIFEKLRDRGSAAI